MKKASSRASVAQNKQSALTIRRDIIGYGGKRGGGRAIVEAKDSLRSRQFATLVDVISEGPIVGLVGGLKGIYLDETPILNQDGSANFFNLRVDWRTGTQAQDPVPGFNGVESEHAVGVQVRQDTAITRTITNPEVDAIRVTLAVAGLTYQDTRTGDIKGWKVDYEIWLQSNGGGFKRVVEAAFDGKTNSRYQRAHLINVPEGSGPWDVRVVRITKDATTANINDKLYWDSYTEIISEKLTYPNTAYVAARVDSSQFSSIPSRAYHIKGMIVQVPSNYNPETRAYVGTWDGNFKPAWTDNPAWCFYDLIVNERYGLGEFIRPDMVDKWTLYSIAQYCDELVPDGRGGMEPRFTCNLYLQTREEALTVLQNMASIFRAIVYWGGGTVVPSQDRKVSVPVMQFTNANVEDGLFVYSNSSTRTRCTVALVSWNDPDDMYRQKIEPVQDDDAIRRYGVIEREVVAFGCTSRSQARRYGKWLLLTERYENETVSFTTGLEGCPLYPGAVIETSDAFRAGARFGGRLVDATETSLTLDSDITLSEGHTHWISAVRPHDGVPVKVAIQNPPGTYRTVNVTALGFVPEKDSIWLSGGSDIAPQTWRVMGIREADGNRVEVTALQYNPSKFDATDRDAPIEVPPASTIRANPAMPTDLSFVAARYVIGGTMVGIKGTLSWSGTASTYIVRYRRATGPWVTREVAEPNIEIDNLAVDVYTFEVTAKSIMGKTSQTARLVIDVNPGPIQLPDVTGLVTDGPFTTNALRLKWNPVAGATSYEVRLTAAATGTVAKRVNVGNTLSYTWTAAEMRQAGGPWRTIKVEVRALGELGAESPWATITASNPQVGQMGSIKVEGGIKAIYVNCGKPDDGDFAGMIVWASTDPAVPATAANQVYDGQDTFVTVSALADGSPLESGIYYIRVAGYDDFGKDDLTLSSAFPVDVFALALDPESITEEMIKNGALTNAKFAQGIEPVGMVDALPPVTGYTGPTVVLNRSDGKIYRLVNGQWTRAVDGADIAAGTVDGAKFAQGIEPVGVVSSLPSLTGYTGPKVILNIADGKTYRLVNGAWKKDVDATDISGQIRSDQIAAGAVDLTKFASGLEGIGIVSSLPSTSGYTGPKTVLLTTDGKLYRLFSGGWVRSTPTSDLTGTISANQIAANAVTAGKIATDAVTAGTIAAGAVSAREVAAGSITADKLVIGDFTNLVENPYLTAGAVGWTTFSGWTLEQDPANAHRGNYVIKATTSGSGTLRNNNVFDVQAGEVLVLRGWFKSDAAAAGTLRLGVIWKSAANADDGFASANAFPEIKHEISGPNAPWTYVEGYIQVPAGKVKAQASAVRLNHTAGTFYVGHLFVAKQAGRTAIADGAITTDKLAAGAVTTNELAAGAVKADNIAAGAVTTGKIAAGAVAADQIAAGALSVGKFGADRWSIQKSFAVDGSDVSGWAKISGSGTFVSVPDSTAVTGGAVVRATGNVVLEWKDNIPFDPSKLYKITVRLRQVTDPTTGGRSFFAGFTGIAADGVTRVNISGANATGSQHYAAASGLVLTAGGGFEERSGFVRGLAAAGATATASTARPDAAAPGNMHANVRFIRPLVYFNHSGGNGVADLDSFQIDVVEIPANSVGVTHIQDGAISTDKLQANSVTASKVVVADTSNLVPDPDLQDAAAWTLNGNMSIVPSPADMPGKNAIYTTASKTAAAGSDFLFDGYATQSPVEPNTEYRIAGTVKSSADATGSWRWEVHQLDAKLANLGSTALTNGALPAATPARAALTIKTLAATRYLRIRIRRGAPAVGGTATGQCWASMPSIVRAANAELIVDGAVTARKIAADAVTAGTIAAGAVNTRELAAGAVTTDKLVVGNFSNNIPNGDFETGDLTNWRPYSGTQTVLPATDASVPAGAPARNVLRLNSAAAGRSAIFSHAKAYADAGAEQDGIAVVPGEQYQVRFFLARSADAVGTRAECRIYYRKTDGTWTANTLLLNTAVTSLPTTWTEQQFSWTVPAGATRAFFYLNIDGGFTAGYVYAARVRVTRVSDTTLIADGAVTTQKIVSAAVNTDKLAANSVTADKLVANAVTADKIAASAVTASKIAAGSINADHLMVGQSSNLLVNPGFEADWYGWNEQLFISGSSSSFRVPPDDWAVAFVTNKTAALYTPGVGNATSVTIEKNQRVAAEEGRTYMVSVYSGSHRCKCDIWMGFYDVNYNYLGVLNPDTSNATNDEERNGGKALSGYKRIWMRGKAPPGTASMVIAIRKFGTKPGYNDSWHFFARPYAGEVGPNQTTPPAWDAAGATVIGPGNIKTGTLSAIAGDLGSIWAGHINLQAGANGDANSFIRSNAKWWGDGSQGFIAARQADASSFFDIVGGSSRFWMSSWGDCGISFPNFRVDNAGNVYVRGDIQANSLTANIVTTQHLVANAVTTPLVAGYLGNGGRLNFTVTEDTFLLFGGRETPAVVLYWSNGNPGSGQGMISTAFSGYERGSACSGIRLGPGSYFITPGSNSSIRDAFVVLFKR